MHTPSSSTSTSHPRPILKHQQTTPNYGRAIRSPERLHAVHFPPSPTLTRTYTAYPPSTYDRSPIVVAPNTCALPERGCPGRTYTLDEDRPVSSSSTSKRSQHGIHLHPRAVFNHQSQVSPSKLGGIDDGSQSTHWCSSPTQPSLIPDLSSGSDESDGSSSDSLNASLKPAPSIPWPPRTLGDSNGYIMTPSYDQYDYPNHSPNVHSTLPFLPYPPSPSDANKVRRQRQKERPWERERGSKYGAYTVDNEPRDKPNHRPYVLYGGFSSSALDGSDDSCLGGF
ncbi:uncharacterized protein F5891DRAFT_1041390 [Suillus fuscotomentosus]|uniref:Uncharacterized protein n=1 Tax=Suillus fuscotomentosus TaxID=1912939 RepID=A0AAD4HJV0_9AGAM|nr:uncharacterized protein F5891DRAFT_1041390 [Suillus fuscotomentosus]KAG1898826.1 hypothetical protein F5891DRAFT_1041390 [Suillus fuscotomentosus]